MPLTFTLDDPLGGVGHRFGINAIASAPSGELFTGGRDGTIRCWDVLNPGAAKMTLNEHTDWVNDVLLLQHGVLATCSSDHTVKLWSLPSDGRDAQCETIGQHEDYARALTFAHESGMLASAGFDRRLLLWDVQRFGQRRLAPVAASDGGHSDSIYALDTNPRGSLIATGSVDTDVRLWDPRDLSSSQRLRGHSDVIRSIKLLPDGVRLVSCGSDRSIRVWHLGERRCEQVLHPHSAPVFSLLARGDSTKLVSGDAAGDVCSVDLVTGRSTLLCRAAGPVLKLHVAEPTAGGRGDGDAHDGAARRQAEGGELLCVATASSSSLECWSLASLLSAPCVGDLPIGSTSCIERDAPSVILPGAAAIRRHASLPSRMQVLAEYDSGEVRHPHACEMRALMPHIACALCRLCYGTCRDARL